MRQAQVVDWQEVTDTHLDRLQARIEQASRPPLDRCETERRPVSLPTINDKILNILIPGNILSCKGIIYKMEKKYQEKFKLDTISTLLPKLVKNGKIKRALVNGKFYYWKLLT